MIEQALEDYSHAYGLGFAALRYFNAAGATPDGDLGEDHDPESHLIPIVLQVALGQRARRDRSSATTIRLRTAPAFATTFTWTIWGMLTSKRWNSWSRAAGCKLNLGTGRGHSVREVVDACRRVTGHPIPADVGARRPGDPPELVADSRRAQTMLGWTPQYTGHRGHCADRLELASRSSRRVWGLKSWWASSRWPRCRTNRMQQILIEKPYKFIPPHRGTWWPTLIRDCNLPGFWLRRAEGVERYELRGGEHLKQSLRAGHGILLTPNHCRLADPLAMGWLAREVRCLVYAMASWHLFQQSRFMAWAIHKMGGFSVYREGVDRQAINVAIEILETAARPVGDLSRKVRCRAPTIASRRCWTVWRLSPGRRPSGGPRP